MANYETKLKDRADAGSGLDNHLTLLAEMSRDFTQTLDIQETLRNGLARIIETVGAEGGALFLLDGERRSVRDRRLTNQPWSGAERRQHRERRQRAISERSQTDARPLLTCQACVGPVDITGLTLPAGEGIVGRSVETNAGEIVRDAAADPNFNSTADQRTGFTTRSILCAPMNVGQDAIGAIELVNKSTGSGLFNEADLSLLMALASAAGLAVRNARMATELVEQQRLRRELELAAEIQRKLLPAEPNNPEIIHGLNRPARTVSGDFFDYFKTADGRIYFTLGDVAGKGMDAALLMAKASSLFRCLGKTVLEPGRLLGLINDEICETSSHGKFITMVCGLFDPVRQTATIANAGHEPPLLRSASGTYRTFPADAPPLGIAPQLTGPIEFASQEIDLADGCLYLFSDGLTEGQKADGEFLGVEGLQDMLDEFTQQPLGERLATIFDTISDRGVTLRDDLTLLAIQGGGAPGLDGLTVRGPQATGEWLLDLKFRAMPGRLRMVRAMVRQAVTDSGGSEDDAEDVVIAVDEACQNIIRHAYGGAAGDILLCLRRDGRKLMVQLRDYADAIDLAKIRPRDLNDVRPGGLGTHFINAAMDEVVFMPPPEGGKGNILRMIRDLSGAKDSTVKAK